MCRRCPAGRALHATGRQLPTLVGSCPVAMAPKAEHGLSDEQVLSHYPGTALRSPALPSRLHRRCVSLRACLAASCWAAAQVKEFKELFDSLDHDGGGHIDVDELAGAHGYELAPPLQNVASVCVRRAQSINTQGDAPPRVGVILRERSTCDAPKSF